MRCREATYFTDLEMIEHYQKRCDWNTLFPETSAIAHARASTHASKFTCTIYYARKILVFSFFVLLLLYISRKEKFFIEGFFIEDYIQEI